MDKLNLIDINTLWYIGLTYTTEKYKEFNNIKPSVWMNNTQTKITIPLEKDAGWVLFNLQSAGVILLIKYLKKIKYKL